MDTRTCVDCGSEFGPHHKKQTYCRVCRLYQNFKFLGTTTQKCWECEGKFAPLQRGDVICGGCDDTARSTDVAGACSFCKKEQLALLHEDVTVCRSCATDPRHRAKFYRALANKRGERRGT